MISLRERKKRNVSKEAATAVTDFMRRKRVEWFGQRKENG